jgi:hypothetical protein
MIPPPLSPTISLRPLVLRGQPTFVGGPPVILPARFRAAHSKKSGAHDTSSSLRNTCRPKVQKSEKKDLKCKFKLCDCACEEILADSYQSGGQAEGGRDLGWME